MTFAALIVSATLSVVRVIDADTLELSDGERLRLLGIDAPETWRPRCDAEAALGALATATVEAWLADALTVEVVTDGTRERWGRLLGDVLVDGDHLANRLIDAGLGAPYFGHGPRPDWCVAAED